MTITVILLLSAMVVAIASAASPRVPLWVAVLLIAIAELLAKGWPR
jgi:hypothetical protein